MDLSKSFPSLFLVIRIKAKFLDQMQLSIMIIHWVVFNLLVKHYQILKDNCFGKTEISPMALPNPPTQ